MGGPNLKNKKYSIILGILIVTVVVALSGCTSNSDQSKYENNNVSFNYPGSWSVTNDTVIDDYGSKFIELKTTEGDSIRIWVRNIENSPVEYDSFSITETVGNNTYKKNSGVSNSIETYVIRKNGKDFVIMTNLEDEDGLKTILGSASF